MSEIKLKTKFKLKTKVEILEENLIIANVNEDQEKVFDNTIDDGVHEGQTSILDKTDCNDSLLHETKESSSDELTAFVKDSNIHLEEKEKTEEKNDIVPVDKFKELHNENNQVNEDIAENSKSDKRTVDKDEYVQEHTENTLSDDSLNIPQKKVSHFKWILILVIIVTTVSVLFGVINNNKNKFQPENNNIQNSDNEIKIPTAFQGKINGKTKRIIIEVQSNNDKIVEFTYSVIGSFSDKNKKGSLNFTKNEAYFETIGKGKINYTEKEIIIKFDSADTEFISLY